MARNKSAELDQWLLLLFAIILSSCVVVSSTNATEGDILITFKSSLSSTSALDNWNASTEPCNFSMSYWAGVLCNNGSVYGLQLQNMGLAGLIDINALSELPALKTISLMNNSFEDPLPDVKRLTLISLYLSQNRFSSDIPDDAFSGMGTLKKVYLAKNGFTGKIPTSLVGLPRLSELDLGDNQFTGEIPNFQPRNWSSLNLINNRLEGQIPASLSDLDPADFEGNSGLCGKPLSPCQMVKKKGTSDGQRIGAVNLYQILNLILVILLYVGIL